MDIHHHKPSTALARARQLRGYRSHLDSQHRRGKQTNTRIERKENIDSIQIIMKEKITYTAITLSTSLFLFLREILLSSQLHKENKNYIKEN